MSEPAAEKEHILNEILRLLGERYEAGCLEWAEIHDLATVEEIGSLEARVNDNFRAGGSIAALKALLRDYWAAHVRIIEGFKGDREVESEETVLSVEGVSGLTLARFSRRDLAVEIESAILKARIWLCSNEKMRSHILTDDPLAICYLPDELKELLRGNLSPESLQAIHNAKLAFPGARLWELIEKGAGSVKDSGAEGAARNKAPESANTQQGGFIHGK